ncbi:MAG: AAA family ATPase [Clostridia bacterium]|nr:AAA family ATPase [Clostridia bacterium]
MGILICGLNGAGKSTLGRALADRLGYSLIDAEDLYFPKTDHGYAYACPRAKEEAARLLNERTAADDSFVFAAVKGEFGPAFLDRLTLAVLVETPRPIRLQRVHDRSALRFGEWVAPGGDLYDRENAFFRAVSARPEDEVENWLARRLSCPVLRVDGTRPPEENAAYIASFLGIF